MSASSHLQEAREHLSTARRVTSDSEVVELISNIESGLEVAPSIVEGDQPMQSRELIRLEHQLDQITEETTTNAVEQKLRAARNHIRDARKVIEENLRYSDE